MALNLNGVDQYAFLEKQILASDAYMDKNAACTFAIWYKPYPHTGRSTVAAACNNQSGSSAYSGFSHDGATNTLGWNVDGNDTVVERVEYDRWHLAIISRQADAAPVASYVGTAHRNYNFISTATGSWEPWTHPSPMNDYPVTAGMITDASGVDFMVGGNYENATAANLFAGKIGSFAIWKGRELDALEISALHGGMEFNTITDGLTEYVDFVGDGLISIRTSISGKALTFVGSPVLDADSPFINPYLVINEGYWNGVNVGGIAAVNYNGFTSQDFTATLDGKLITTTSNSISVPALSNGVTGPRFSELYDRRLVVTNSLGQSAETFLKVSAPNGKSYTTLTAGFLTDTTSVVNGFTEANAVGDFIVFDPTAITVNSDASFIAIQPGAQTIWHVSGTTGMVYEHTFPFVAGVQMDFRVLVKNLSSPFYDGHYPAGNRPQ